MHVVTSERCGCVFAREGLVNTGADVLLRDCEQIMCSWFVVSPSAVVVVVTAAIVVGASAGAITFD